MSPTDHGLTDDEQTFAKAFGMTPEAYAANKSRQPPSPEAIEAAEAADAEHERIKQAVREALAEADR